MPQVPRPCPARSPGAGGPAFFLPRRLPRHPRVTTNGGGSLTQDKMTPALNAAEKLPRAVSGGGRLPHREREPRTPLARAARETRPRAAPSSLRVSHADWRFCAERNSAFHTKGLGTHLVSTTPKLSAESQGVLPLRRILNQGAMGGGGGAVRCAIVMGRTGVTGQHREHVWHRREVL